MSTASQDNHIARVISDVKGIHNWKEDKKKSQGGKKEEIFFFTGPVFFFVKSGKSAQPSGLVVGLTLVRVPCGNSWLPGLLFLLRIFFFSSARSSHRRNGGGLAQGEPERP